MQPLLALSLVVFAQPQDGQQLFRAMEQKITAAKSLKLACKTSVESGTNVYRVDLKLWAAQGNRLRLEAVAALGAKKDNEIVVVSNGKKTAIVQPAKDVELRDNPPDYIQKVLELLARTAVGTALDELLRPGSQPTAAAIELSKFKLGVKEKLDGKRQAQIVEYEIVLKEKAESLKIKVKLWIDTESLLPVHRAMTIMIGASETRFTEVFTEFTLDPAIDAKMFELPKQ
jgi:outer membrane lipoprotein-sorting protein